MATFKIPFCSQWRAEHFGILNAFLRHHIRELRTFKNGPVFFGPPCNRPIKTTVAKTSTPAKKNTLLYPTQSIVFAIFRKLYRYTYALCRLYRHGGISNDGIIILSWHVYIVVIITREVCAAVFWTNMSASRAIKRIGCSRTDGRVDRVASTSFHAHSGARSPVRSRCRRCSTSGRPDVRSVRRTCRDSGSLQKRTHTLLANRHRLCIFRSIL